MKLGETFKWASAAFALIPGLAIIITSLGVPPGLSSVLMGGVIEAIGALTLLILWINNSTIGKLSIKNTNRATAGCVSVFLISILAYILLFNMQTVYSSQYDKSIFFPFWANQDLQFMITEQGSKINAINSYGPQAVLDAINSDSTYVELTKLILCTIYVVVFESLVIGFGLAGIKIEKKVRIIKKI